MKRFAVQFDNGNGRYEWTHVHADRYKVRNGAARFYVGKDEVAYFYDVQAVVVKEPNE